MEMYCVKRYGEKVTLKYFYDFDEALVYYDRACKRNHNSAVFGLEKITGTDGSERHTTLYRSYDYTHFKEGEYRNIKSTAKKKKDGQMHPFGL